MADETTKVVIELREQLATPQQSSVSPSQVIAPGSSATPEGGLSPDWRSTPESRAADWQRWREGMRADRVQPATRIESDEPEAEPEPEIDAEAIVAKLSQEARDAGDLIGDLLLEKAQQAIDDLTGPIAGELARDEAGQLHAQTVAEEHDSGRPPEHDDALHETISSGNAGHAGRQGNPQQPEQQENASGGSHLAGHLGRLGQAALPNSPLAQIAIAGAKDVHGIASAGELGAGAAVAAGALTALSGPLLIAAGAVAALGATFYGLNRVAGDLAESLTNISPDVALANAEGTIEKTLALYERADKIGVESGKYTQAENDIAVTLQKIETEIGRAILPQMTEILHATTGMLELFRGFLGYLNDVKESYLLDSLSSGIAAAIKQSTGGIDLGPVIAAAAKAAKEQNALNKEKTASELVQNYKDFIDPKKFMEEIVPPSLRMPGPRRKPQAWGPVR